MSGSAIPASFFPALKTFAEFSRKKVRINTIGNTVANPGELVQILLLEGKIDLSTFSLGGYLTTTTGTGSTRAGPVQTLIEQKPKRRPAEARRQSPRSIPARQLPRPIP